MCREPHRPLRIHGPIIRQHPAEWARAVLADMPHHAPPPRKHVTVIRGIDNHVTATGKRRILCRPRDPRARRLNGPLERPTITYQTFELVKAVGEELPLCPLRPPRNLRNARQRPIYLDLGKGPQIDPRGPLRLPERLRSLASGQASEHAASGPEARVESVALQRQNLSLNLEADLLLSRSVSVC